MLTPKLGPDKMSLTKLQLITEEISRSKYDMINGWRQPLVTCSLPGNRNLSRHLTWYLHIQMWYSTMFIYILLICIHESDDPLYVTLLAPGQFHGASKNLIYLNFKNSYNCLLKSFHKIFNHFMVMQRNLAYNCTFPWIGNWKMQTCT